MISIGLDIGGTKISAGLVKDGEIVKNSIVYVYVYILVLYIYSAIVHVKEVYHASHSKKPS